MTPGQANDDGVLCAFGGIVFFELRAQPPRLTTHNGIDLGIVNRLSTEDKHPNGCLFEVLGFALQRRLHDERKATLAGLMVGPGSTAAQISVGEGVWNASCDSGNPGSITGFGLS